MKRDINEIYKILNNKRENAFNDMVYEKNRQYPSNKKILRLQGEIEAYTDVIILIESSQILDEKDNT